MFESNDNVGEIIARSDLLVNISCGIPTYLFIERTWLAPITPAHTLLRIAPLVAAKNRGVLKEGRSEAPSGARRRI
jgi:hypothetical protein